MKIKIRESNGKSYEFNSELSDKIGIYKDFLEENHWDFILFSSVDF